MTPGGRDLGTSSGDAGRSCVGPKRQIPTGDSMGDLQDPKERNEFGLEHINNPKPKHVGSG